MVELRTVPGDIQFFFNCGRLGGSLGGMPLAGSLPDLDADGSRYSMRHFVIYQETTVII